MMYDKELEKENRKSLFHHGFSYVAMWQFAAFSILFLLVWLNEFIDIASLLYAIPKRTPDVTRACLSSAGVLLAAIIAVGHTYVQQQNLVFGMLTICSYCHKVRISEADWERIEAYVSKRTAAGFSHGICPTCFERVRAEIAEPKLDAGSATSQS